jgi:Tol biopolymer transport system component
VSLSGLMSGDYLLNVSGIAVNCELDGPNPYRLSLGSSDGAVANLNFTCAPAKKLAFASIAEGNPAIYVANANGTEITRLTSATDRAAAPAWSPDGSRIAYTSELDGSAQIYVMNADGSNPVRLSNAAGGNFRPAWSPDGSKIAFTTSRDGNGEIYVMNSDGSGLVNLTQNPAEDGDPAWSPDGTRIAFRSTRDGPGVYVMNADGSAVTRLTNDPYVTDGQPAWSPDGGWLAVSRLWCAEWCIQSIFLMSAFDGSAGAITALNPECETHTDPVWYPEGFKITFTNTDYCSGETSVNFLRISGPQALTQGDRITFGFNASWRP